MKSNHWTSYLEDAWAAWPLVLWKHCPIMNPAPSSSATIKDICNWSGGALLFCSNNILWKHLMEMFYENVLWKILWKHFMKKSNENILWKHLMNTSYENISGKHLTETFTIFDDHCIAKVRHMLCFKANLVLCESSSVLWNDFEKTFVSRSPYGCILCNKAFLKWEFY